jgi:hypothetical protein
MTTRTRYFVISSLLVLGCGVGTGLVAYYAGFPMTAFGRRGGPEELVYVPRDATVVAYADVRGVMSSELRRKVHEAVPMSENGQREFQDQTGINIETDIDHVVAFVSPGSDADSLPASHGFSGGGMVLARGIFDEVKIEALMREHGAHIEGYKGKRLIVGEIHKGRHPENDDTRPAATRADGFALAFVEPGLAAVGHASLVRAAIDNQASGQNVTANDDMMNRVRALDSGNAWAVGRFDALQKQARLPASVAGQIPPITWFSISSHVNGGIRGVIQAETRDEESANNLRDVVRGLMALAKLQTGSKPELQTMMQALELGGSGKTVALSFAIPSEIFDILGKAAKSLPAKVGH